MYNKNLDILTIGVNTKSGRYEGDLSQELHINIDNISESFIDQPAKFAWWAVLAAQARAKADKVKSEIDNLKDYMSKTLMGELDAKVRQQLELDGEKITESKVTNAIYNHPVYIAKSEQLQELRLKFADANGDASILESAREALNQRKDMLISLGAQLRVETNNTELSAKKERAKEALKQRHMYAD